MPVPWDCSDLGLMEEPLDTTTVVSEDIWKKFDLDFFDLDICHDGEFDDGFLHEPYGKGTCLESREIRHHDCMWAGLCISKEHNRTLPAKKNSHVHRKVPAGRSLLIPKATTVSTISQQHQQQELHQNQLNLHRHKHKHKQLLKQEPEEDEDDEQQQHQQQRRQHQQQHQTYELTSNQQCHVTNLESDGDSTRPETPQNSESEIESEDEGLTFRHDHIDIHERLSECMSETKAVPVSEVTGQLVRQVHEKRKHEDAKYQQDTDIRTTLSDHSYHINQPTSKKLEHLGVQTPSDSEEEIDVVNFEKPCKPAALPTYPSPADQQQFQLTVNTAFKEKTPSIAATSTPRPRGRPPANPARKRTAQPEPKPAKRAKSRTYQKRSKVSKATTSPVKIELASPSKASTSSRSSSDEEPDTEKRSWHNNMERQRRVELRNAFEELRLLVPEVEAKEKAPKVAILRQAARYCDLLTEIGQITTVKVAEMKRKQERLRARLSQLRRDLAMTR